MAVVIKITEGLGFRVYPPLKQLKYLFCIVPSDCAPMARGGCVPVVKGGCCS